MTMKRYVILCVLVSFMVPAYATVKVRGIELALVSDPVLAEELQEAYQKCQDITDMKKQLECINNLPMSQTPIEKCRDMARKGISEAIVKKCFKELSTSNFQIKYITFKDRKPKSFSNGSVLCSGASYKLVFESNKDSYVYIFQIDSAHKIFRLFPSGDFKKASTRNQNPVKKETEYFVPGKKTSFKLDKVVGKETIYFVVTHKRNKKLEAQYEKMVTQQEGNSEQTRGAVRKEWHSTMQKRGIEPEVSNDPGIFPTFLTDVCEGCAYNLTFQHSDCQ